MKPIIVIVLFVISSAVKAQTYDEWARQKKTQKKYLLDQILALRTYGSYLTKGYSVVKGGLNTIQQIKRGDLKLHEKFFESFRVVSPAVRQYSKVGDITRMQYNIVKRSGAELKRWRASDQLTASEVIYLEDVIGRLLDDCLKTLDALYNVVNDTKLEMKDEGRIQLIDALYVQMVDQNTFLESFTASANRLVMQRKVEAKGIKLSKKLNGLK